MQQLVLASSIWPWRGNSASVTKADVRQLQTSGLPHQVQCRVDGEVELHKHVLEPCDPGGISNPSISFPQTKVNCVARWVRKSPHRAMAPSDASGQNRQPKDDSPEPSVGFLNSTSRSRTRDRPCLSHPTRPGIRHVLLAKLRC